MDSEASGSSANEQEEQEDSSVELEVQKVIKASSFGRNGFWGWVQGVKLATLPYTGLEVVCKREAVEGVAQVVCQQCTEVWERSGLKSTLQVGRREILKQGSLPQLLQASV